MSRRIIAIVNAAAGAIDTQTLVPRLQAAFDASSHGVRVVLADDASDMVAKLRATVGEHPDVIVAGGGDGTLNAIAAELLDGDIALGVLPLGTFNHFAKALRLPLDLDGAVEAIVHGRETPVDVGEVNGRVFLNNSSLGLYPSLVRHRERQQEQLGRSKWAAAVWAALALLRRHSLLHVHLSLDEREIDRRTAGVFIGNNAYHMSGLKLGQRDCLDAGRLGVYLPHHGGRVGLSMLVARALCGRLRESVDFDALLASSLVVETHHRRLPVAIDGEIMWMDAPLRYRTRARALKVMVPPADPHTGLA
ncbi:MAG: diacylglycerol kinase family protein [Rhodanobacteraceae bacterium]